LQNQHAKTKVSQIYPPDYLISVVAVVEGDTKPQGTTDEATVEEGNEKDDSFEDWDGDDIRNCADLIYKFTLNNNTGTPICYKIKLSERPDNAPVNLHWPRAGLKG
jgi:hypothetical protein